MRILIDSIDEQFLTHLWDFIKEYPKVEEDSSIFRIIGENEVIEINGEEWQ